MAYAFLLSLLRPDPFLTSQWLLAHWCPRTGKWQHKVMLALFILVMAVPALREFFELVELHWWDYLIITGLVCVWALLQRMIWRSRLFERILGIYMI